MSLSTKGGRNTAGFLWKGWELGVQVVRADIVI